MVVRGHVVCVTVHLVGNAVIAHIHEDKDVLTTDGCVENALGFPGAKAGALYFYKIIVFHIAMEGGILLKGVV